MVEGARNPTVGALQGAVQCGTGGGMSGEVQSKPLRTMRLVDLPGLWVATVFDGRVS